MKEKIEAIMHWRGDFKTGKSISHQPPRNTFHSQWYLLQREKEGNPVKD